ncbi:hypothetical protein [Microvirga soli]|uniref:hypothetical protein n=1 Tax=Microvirga soli TaxID=1854496 RepID=UPI00191DB60D|nr:hypothetical protein [Microvirga soli]
MNTSAEEFHSADQLTVPADLFRFMLQLLLTAGSFNEAGYLRDNPDVAEAVKNGQVRSARLHYIGYGFFEGRAGATPDVDEAWYRETYPDIDAAIRAGKINSAAEHFIMAGAAEGRSPNARAQQDAYQWKVAFGRAPEHQEEQPA